MNQDERDAVQSFLRSRRGKHARSFGRDRTKEEMNEVRSFITTDSIRKRSVSLMGHPVYQETKDKIRLKALGRKHSEETKEKIRAARSKQTITPKMLASLAEHRGEKSPLWKGTQVGYRALHRWVEHNLGKPDCCQNCSKNELKGHDIHWANKSGEYKRELSDWMRLCALCHKQYDKQNIIG